MHLPHSLLSCSSRPLNALCARAPSVIHACPSLVTRSSSARRETTVGSLTVVSSVKFGLRHCHFVVNPPSRRQPTVVMDPQSSPQGSPRGSFSAPDPHAELAQLKVQMQQMYAAMQQQMAQQAAAHQSVPQSSPSSSSAPRLPKIRSPSSYSGAGGNAVDDWLSEMQQQFAYYGAQFPDDSARVLFAVAYLDGSALMWWEHVPADQHPSLWGEFVILMRDRYRPVQAEMLARQRIGKLRMGPNHSVNSVHRSVPDHADAHRRHGRRRPGAPLHQRPAAPPRRQGVGEAPEDAQGSDRLRGVG